MLNSKQRAYLRSLANEMEPIIQIGKGGMSDNLILQVAEALDARELVKGKILNNSLVEVRDAANDLAEATEAEVVQVIGSTFVLYRRSDEDPQIELP